MNDTSCSPLLLFYPTSPVHVRDIQLLIEKLPGWRSAAVWYRPLARVTPGIDDALDQQGITYFDLNGDAVLENVLPVDATVLLLGIVADRFALDLFAWAKQLHKPVIAIEEVAQLALNQLGINNYYAPFDRLFVASREEQQLFLQLEYPSEMLRISGLLANDRLSPAVAHASEEILEKLGISNGQKPIIYTTSPIRNRLGLHNRTIGHLGKRS
jgi:hypothetical protein